MTKKVRNLQNCKIGGVWNRFLNGKEYRVLGSALKIEKVHTHHQLGKRKVKQLPTATVDSTDTEICKNPAIFCTI